MNWKMLESISQFDKLIQSNARIAVFKHSTRCIISKMALRKLEEEFQTLNFDFDFYFLDLIKYRKLSNHISEVLNVQHESPQLIVIKEGQSIYNDSHSSITLSDIR